MQLKVDRYQTTGGLGVLPGTRAEAVIIRAGGGGGGSHHQSRRVNRQPHRQPSLRVFVGHSCIDAAGLEHPADLAQGGARCC
jgi:hypothetical protein